MADPWIEQPLLEGRHVLLRPMARSDGPAIVEAASDGRLWELFYTVVPGPESIDAYLDRAERGGACDSGHEPHRDGRQPGMVTRRQVDRLQQQPNRNPQKKPYPNHQALAQAGARPGPRPVRE